MHSSSKVCQSKSFLFVFLYLPAFALLIPSSWAHTPYFRDLESPLRFAPLPCWRNIWFWYYICHNPKSIICIRFDPSIDLWFCFLDYVIVKHKNVHINPVNLCLSCETLHSSLLFYYEFLQMYIIYHFLKITINLKTCRSFFSTYTS